jgi:broad specificity phosphatase PhoE
VTTLLLVRHGETDWNREGRFQGHADPPLNDLGRRQAAAVAEQLARAGTSAVYSSDLRRAFATATIVAARLGVTPHPHPGLREVDVGAWSGLTRDEIAERFPESFQRWVAGGEPPEWEARTDFVARVGTALLELAARHAGERLVVVGHGGTIRAAERHAGVEPSWPIGNCAIVELQAADGRLWRPASASTAAV